VGGVAGLRVWVGVGVGVVCGYVNSHDRFLLSRFVTYKNLFIWAAGFDASSVCHAMCPIWKYNLADYDKACNMTILTGVPRFLMVYIAKHFLAAVAV